MEMDKKNFPKDWKQVKLGDVCVKISNGSSAKQFEEKIGFPISRIETIWNSQIDYNRVKYVQENDEAFVEKYGLQDGDILFSHINSDIHLGKTAVYQKLPGQQLIHGINLLLVRPSEELVPKFLNYQLQSIRARGGFIAIAQKSVNQSSINQSKLKQVELALPPLAEQARIVAEIEALFSELDAGKAELQKAAQQLKTYRQAVLKFAFEGRLTNDAVVDGELPEGWSSEKISDVAEINPKLLNKASIDGELEVQFVPMKLVEEIVNKVHLVETKKFKEVQKGSYTPFVNGDIVFAKVTPCMENGKVAVVENLKNGIGFGSSEFHVLRPSEEVERKYLFHFIVQEKFRKEAENVMSGAVGLRRVPKQFIEDYQIPLPPLEEQHRIVQEIEARLSVCDKIEETIAQNLQRAGALRQSILKKAFEGSLTSQVPA